MDTVAEKLSFYLDQILKLSTEFSTDVRNQESATRILNFICSHVDALSGFLVAAVSFDRALKIKDHLVHALQVVIVDLNPIGGNQQFRNILLSCGLSNCFISCLSALEMIVNRVELSEDDESLKRILSKTLKLINFDPNFVYDSREVSQRENDFISGLQQFLEEQSKIRFLISDLALGHPIDLSDTERMEDEAQEVIDADIGDWGSDDWESNDFYTRPSLSDETTCFFSSSLIDDDDNSWVVRRAAVRVLFSLTKNRTNLLNGEEVHVL